MKKNKNSIKAHEVSGHVTMREHIEKMHSACQKACMNDDRFNKEDSKSDFARGYSTFKPKPYVVDITTPDSNDKHNAIIMTADNRLVRHGFDFNKDIGEAKFIAGDSTPTESTRVYAHAIEKHENMIKASQTLLSCRGTNGTKLDASGWKEHSPVEFVYVPGGISTISAGFRENESITCTVEVDENTAKDLQESFDYIAATDKQEPYADEDHEARKATLRFPTDKIKFVYGTLREGEGVIVKGAEPTSYGAECVNGKVYRSWSPEFATDADYSKAKSKKNHWTFPEGVRGSASNPARIVALGFVTGALTNKPAFKNMPPVKAKLATPERQDEQFVKAAKEEDGILLNDLNMAVCEAAKTDDRFKSDPKDGFFTWCCDLRLSDSDAWSAIIQAKGKLYEIDFEIEESDPVKIKFGIDAKEVARKTEYISASDKKEFLLNGKLVKAGAPAGNKNAAGKHEGEHSSKAKSEFGKAAHAAMYAKAFPDEASEHAKTATESAETATKHAADAKSEDKGMAHHWVAGTHRAAERANSHSGNYQAQTHHGIQAELHERYARAVKDAKHADHERAMNFKASDKAEGKESSILDILFAQNQKDAAFLESIALKIPEVQARELEKNKPAIPVVESILARKQADSEVIDRIIAQNPLLQNRDIIDKVASNIIQAAEDGGFLVKDKDGKEHLPTHKGGKPDHTLMGAAWAALHGGYRGNKYEGSDKTEAKKKLKALYKKEGMETPSE